MLCYILSCPKCFHQIVSFQISVPLCPKPDPPGPGCPSRALLPAPGTGWWAPKRLHTCAEMKWFIKKDVFYFCCQFATENKTGWGNRDTELKTCCGGVASIDGNCIILWYHVSLIISNLYDNISQHIWSFYPSIPSAICVCFKMIQLQYQLLQLFLHDCKWCTGTGQWQVQTFWPLTDRTKCLAFAPLVQPARNVHV